jgi:sugar porter (SP) family MFS transporter
MLGEIDEELRRVLKLDVVGINTPGTMFGFASENWKPFNMPDGTPVLVPEKFNYTIDEQGDILIYPQGDTSAAPCAKMPKTGYFFDSLNRQRPIDESKLNPADNCEEFGVLSVQDLKYYADTVKKIYEETSYGIYMTLGGMGFGDIACVPAPWMKNPKGIRDVEEWYVSTAIRRDYVYKVFEKQCEYALENIELAAKAVGDRVQVVFVSGADFGTQRGLFISPDAYRDLYKPFHKQVNDKIHRLTKWKTFIHSCGSIVKLIPEFIDAGFDILNPVQCSADGMNPAILKKEFGKSVVFWGGGVDTQQTLAFGMPDEVYRQVRERIDIFNRDGGFVFNAIHNILATTPVENILAMFKAIGDSYKSRKGFKMVDSNLTGQGKDTSPCFNMSYIWVISLIAALGGFLFGYDWVVIGGAKPFFEKYFQLQNEFLIGWANSCALLGCLLGSLLSGAISDFLGRKKLLIISAVLFAVSSALTGWSMTFLWFVVWRILGGVAIGVASNVSPMYIAEISPAYMRGKLVAINQLTVVIGILAAQLINLLIAQKVPQDFTAEMIRQSWNGQYGWRWMFTAVTIPSLVFLVGALLVPESPRWLVKNGKSGLARKIMARIGGIAYADSAVRDIETTITGQEIQRVRFKDLLESKVVKILAIGIVLAVLQQWCGINVIFNYAEEIFKAAGYDISDTLKNIAWTGSINLLFTFVALGAVDKGGRRALMLFGSLGLAAIYIIMGVCYQTHIKGFPMLLLTLIAIGCYAMSLAPVTWVLISEIFPNRIRGAAVSIAVSSLWIACFILTFTFPILNTHLGPAGTFWAYAAVCIAGFVFILMRVPETKGKSLEQIERELS